MDLQDAANDGECKNCESREWVCESHPDHAWAGLTGGDECCGGAGMPCGACNLRMASAGYVEGERERIKGWLRSLAPSYSGWNDHDEIYDKGWNDAVSWVVTALEQRQDGIPRPHTNEKEAE